MDEDWRNAFGIVVCREICDGDGDGDGAGKCDGTPSSCSSLNSNKVLYQIRS